MSSQRRQSPSEITARRWKKRIRRFLLACFFLQLIVVGAGLYSTGNLYFRFPKREAAPHVAVLEKNNPVEEKGAVPVETGKTAAQPQKSVPLAEAADSGRIGNGIVALKNVDATVAVAEKSEEMTTEMKPSESQQEQEIPVISQTDKPATAADPASEVISQEPSGHRYYTVRVGDNLGFISTEAYGTSTRWRVIAEANTDQLGNNPNRLRPGMKLIIPVLKETGNTLLQPGLSSSLQQIE